MGTTAYTSAVTLVAGTDSYMEVGAGLSGTVSILYFYAPTGGAQVAVGIYSDNSGQPGNLLASSTSFTALPGWNTTLLTSSTNVTGGNNYWLGIYANSSMLVGGGMASGSYLTQTASSLPSLYGGGGSSTAGWLAFFADICPSAGFTSTPTNINTPTQTPTTTPTVTFSFTPTSTMTPCAGFIGDNNQESQFTGGIGQMELNRYQATANTTLYQMSAYMGSGYYNLVIYSDDGTGSKPTTLLGQTGVQIATASSGGWALASLTQPVSVIAGNYYWLGEIINQPSGNTFWYTAGSNILAVEPQSSFTINAPPASFSGTVYTGSNSIQISLYAIGCGSGGSITLTSTPTVTTTITSTPTTPPFQTFTVTPTMTGCGKVDVYTNALPLNPVSAGTTAAGIVFYDYPYDSYCSSATYNITNMNFTATTSGNLASQIQQVQLWQGGVGGTLLGTTSFSGSGFSITGSFGNPTFTLAYVFSPTASGAVQTTITYINGDQNGGSIVGINLPVYSGPLTVGAVPTNTPTVTPTMTYSSTPTTTNTPATDPGTVTQTFTLTSTFTPTLTGTPTSTASPTPTLSNWSFSGPGTIFNSGTYYFGCVDIEPGATVYINGGVTFITQCFNLEAGATINGVGAGYSASRGFGGPGEGGIAVAFATPGPVYLELGAGGGHGGAGATVCLGPYAVSGNPATECGNGGPANDDPVHPSLWGSMGAIVGNPYSSNENAGGGLFKLVVYNPVANQVGPATINGVIDMSGLSGTNDLEEDPNGGGAGGTILIEASSISGTGILQANGGSGIWLGGGGGGGIISLVTNSAFSGGLSASGGGGGGGGPVTYTTPPPNGY